MGIMMRQSLMREAPGDYDRLRATGFIAAAALYGVAIAVLPWPVAIGFFVAPLVLVIALARPEIGWLLIVAMVVEVIPSGLQPTLTLGSGGIKAYDFVLGILAVSQLLRYFLRRPTSLAWPGVMSLPLLYLLAGVSVSVCYVLIVRPNANWLSEARVQLLWLLLPLAVIGIDTPERHRRLIIGIVGFGLVIAGYMIMQAFLGLHIMTDARIEALDIYSNADVTRSIAGGGIYLLVFALILSINGLIHRRVGWPAGLTAVVTLTLGLAVQYGRGIWLAAAAGLLLSAFLYRGLVAAVSTGLVAALAVALLLIGLSIERPRVAEALIERATGILEEVDSGASLRWRFVENRDALFQIEQHPLLGVGIGGEYKAANTHSFPNETRYLHNGYLYFPLKLGLWAGAIPATFVGVFVLLMRRILRRAQPSSMERLYAASLAGAGVVPVLTCFTQPEWTDPRGVTALAALFSLLLLLLRDGYPEKPATQPPS
jgi:hypothetical protein